MNPGHARRDAAGGEVGAHSVACSVFLARHSAYIDDELLPQERQAHERHLESCDACGRYARVLAGGLDVLQSMPEVEPSADFEARLQHRLFHLQDEAVLSPRRGRTPWLAAAAAMALLAVGYRAFSERAAPADWSAGATFPAPASVHPHEDVFVNRAELWEPAVVPIALTSTSGLLRTGGYTPVVVREPQFRGVRDLSVGD